MTRPHLTGCIVPLYFLSVLGSCTATTSRSSSGEQVTETTMQQIRDLTSSERQIRDVAVDAILAERQTAVNQLMQVVKGEEGQEYSFATRAAATYVLGELRAVQAVDVLVRALAEEEAMPFERSDITRYDAPYFTALVKIGRPSVPAMIENIRTSDEDLLGKKSLDVLYHVLGGKRRVLELLEKLHARESDEQALRRLESASQWTSQHFTEREEPLF